MPAEQTDMKKLTVAFRNFANAPKTINTSYFTTSVQTAFLLMKSVTNNPLNENLCFGRAIANFWFKLFCLFHLLTRCAY